MQFRRWYGKVVYAGHDRADGWNPQRLVDDLLGVPDDEAAWMAYVMYMLRYGVPGLSVSEWVEPVEATLDEGTAAEAIEVATERLTDLHVRLRPIRDQLLQALPEAANGRLSAQLSNHLARVTSIPGGIVEIDDLEALAAWSLAEVLRSRHVEPTVCPSCKKPWLGGRSEFCSRPDFGSQTLCRSRVAQARFRDRNNDYRLERRRLYERMKRGTVEEAVYKAWLKNNRPGVKGEAWVPFKEWEAQHGRNS